MLQKIRIIVGGVFFLLITLLFLDFTGIFHLWFGWMAKIQLIPAILALNIVAIVTLVLLTLIFGRIYCSVICPLGVFQDIVSNISGKRKKNRFRYSSAKTWLRYGILAVFIISAFAGISVVVSILDPYAAYGRMASNFLTPIYRLGNNLLASLAERVDSYAFYSTDVWIKGWITFAIAAISLIVVTVLAWRHGRTYCNTICPVGTILGFISQFSLFKPVFDTEKCNGCGLCARNCKSSCINTKEHHIDYSRCVTCFNCIEKCKSGAIKYAPVKIGKRTDSDKKKSILSDKGANVSRRNVLSTLALFTVTGAIKAQQQLQVDGGLADIEDKKVPDRKTPLVPPGAQSRQNMNQHCTACQLCISACPNNILRPSEKLSTFMQPEMSFERGFCRPECTECSHVCPAGAIKPITTADKTAISIGQAVWIKDNCVVNRDNLQCTSCERHCPTGAISLVAINPEDEKSLKVPIVQNEMCIGCGSCEHHCPARPFSAIYVEGNIRHHIV
jgi:polyferredoxin